MPVRCSADPWAPASVGDYIAGPSHVLPTFGSARFGQALTVADFTRRCTWSPSTRPRSARSRRTSPRSPKPKVSPLTPRRCASAPRSRRDEPAAGSRRPTRARRLSLAAGRGRGAPQHERVTRSAAHRVARRVRCRAQPRRLAPIPGSRRHRAAQCHRRAARGRERSGLRGQRVERGAADAAADLRRAWSHRPDLRTHVPAALAHLTTHRDDRRRGRAHVRLRDRSHRREASDR